LRRTEDPTPPSAIGTLGGAGDIRLSPKWKTPTPLDTYSRAQDPDEKTVE
jgi:hypothetical protein